MELKSRRLLIKLFASLPFGVLAQSGLKISSQKEESLFYILCETHFNRKLSQKNYHHLTSKFINRDKLKTFFQEFQNNGVILKTKSVFQPTKNVWMSLFKDYPSYKNWCDVCDENHLYDFQARSTLGFNFKFYAIYIPKSYINWELEEIYKEFSSQKKDISNNSSSFS